jgi:hypothetical protein
VPEVNSVRDCPQISRRCRDQQSNWPAKRASCKHHPRADQSQYRSADNAHSGRHPRRFKKSAYESERRPRRIGAQDVDLCIVHGLVQIRGGCSANDTVFQPPFRQWARRPRGASIEQLLSHRTVDSCQVSSAIDTRDPGGNSASSTK